MLAIVGSAVLPRYDIKRSYDWNYAHAPELAPQVDVPSCAGDFDFCGIPVNSPLGIPAGPLLNSRWLLYYGALGFDVLTYKTVRSRLRECYAPPNLLPIDAPPLDDSVTTVTAACAETGSWAISFGMPSKEPPEWQADVECARLGMKPGQVLVVSVVASPQSGWRLADISADFSECARYARESGAQAIEANLSCPNVCTAEGDLYLSPEASEQITGSLRAAVPDLPLILKIGRFPTAEAAEAFVRAVSPHVNALSTVNSLTAAVRDRGGEPLFGGVKRGIGGECIRDRCQAEAVVLRGVLGRFAPHVKLIGVGGIFSAAHVRERLAAGAHHVQLATAPMLNPLVGLQIRKQL
jgi:dihydroorotate dehydrogenase